MLALLLLLLLLLLRLLLLLPLLPLLPLPPPLLLLLLLTALLLSTSATFFATGISLGSVGAIFGSSSATSAAWKRARSVAFLRPNFLRRTSPILGSALALLLSRFPSSTYFAKFWGSSGGASSTRFDMTAIAHCVKSTAPQSSGTPPIIRRRQARPSRRSPLSVSSLLRFNGEILIARKIAALVARSAAALRRA